MQNHSILVMHFMMACFPIMQGRISLIKSREFTAKTERAIPPNERMGNEGKHPHFIAFDFGIAEKENGSLYPALIEMQGFPTLFAYHAYFPKILEQFFNIPAEFSHYFNDLHFESYISLLKKVIIGDHQPDEVILLEIKPYEQKTRIDFYCTEKYLGIKSVCLTALIAKFSIWEQINWSYPLIIAVAAVFTAQVTSRLASRTPTVHLKQGFALLLIALATFTIFTQAI